MIPEQTRPILKHTHGSKAPGIGTHRVLSLNQWRFSAPCTSTNYIHSSFCSCLHRSIPRSFLYMAQYSSSAPNKTRNLYLTNISDKQQSRHYCLYRNITCSCTPFLRPLTISLNFIGTGTSRGLFFLFLSRPPHRQNNSIFPHTGFNHPHRYHYRGTT